MTLVGHAAGLTAWLHDTALPLWWINGADRESGGFREALELDGSVRPRPRRARVQPRQIYCFAQAGRRGWDGPWRTAVEHGLAFFDRAYLQPGGFYGALAADDGMLLDASFDLYNQAFALFAFAQAAEALPARARLLEARAHALLAHLRRTCAHPLGGFDQALPRELPLCSNPHMHLFEAAMAWEDAAAGSPAEWRALSDEIAELCMTRFMDGETGALREFFDADWRPYPGDQGRVVEPGHQFEWAWLLLQWGSRRGDQRAIAAARRLFAIGAEHGICPERGVAVMALRDDFSVLDPVARLWPQPEWLKIALRLAELSSGAERRRYLASAAAACEAIKRFLDVPVAGLWRDKMRPDGSFVDEPAPASSFYHLVCAISELDALAPQLEQSRRPAYAVA